MLLVFESPSRFAPCFRSFVRADDHLILLRQRYGTCLKEDDDPALPSTRVQFRLAWVLLRVTYIPPPKSSTDLKLNEGSNLAEREGRVGVLECHWFIQTGSRKQEKWGEANAGGMLDDKAIVSKADAAILDAIEARRR
ncbi:hypothetical protein A0H81_10201 [Grifola frondosa]|uniref:Uncharacterized protein n=1 Tax=Grifola frondosa TaxID=5627 RepID=A0A1C7LY36_GRIFR|nr:hypothetical protein A0H81_10201 [Grifola frondosa]